MPVWQQSPGYWEPSWLGWCLLPRWSLPSGRLPASPGLASASTFPGSPRLALGGLAPARLLRSWQDTATSTSIPSSYPALPVAQQQEGENQTQPSSSSPPPRVHYGSHRLESYLSSGGPTSPGSALREASAPGMREPGTRPPCAEFQPQPGAQPRVCKLHRTSGESRGGEL